MKKIKYILLIICFLALNCERGWIWDTIGLEETSPDGELRFEVEYNGNLKLFEGINTTGLSIMDKNVNDGDIFTEILSKGDYTIKWSTSSGVDAESLTLDDCKLVKLKSGFITTNHSCD